MGHWHNPKEINTLLRKYISQIAALPGFINQILCVRDVLRHSLLIIHFRHSLFLRATSQLAFIV